jgi:3-mercaptopyruvate sulfurtransferase SseA
MMIPLLIILFMLSSACNAREIPPFVSADWLGKNLRNPGMIIIDIRDDAEYRKSHIQGAINVSINKWAVERQGLVREVPDEKALTKLLGSIGAKSDSKIIVVGRGIRILTVLMLSGWHGQSLSQGLRMYLCSMGLFKVDDREMPVTADIPVIKPVKYDGKIDLSSIVSKAYVIGRISKAVIVDARRLTYIQALKQSHGLQRGSY